METIDKSLVRYFQSIPDITNVVGNNIFMGRKPQGTPLFSMTVQRQRSPRNYVLEGEDGCHQPLLEVMLWGRGPHAVAKIDDLAQIVWDNISGYRGPAGENFIEWMRINNDGWDIPTQPSDGSDDWFFTYSYSVRISYGQALPKVTGA